MILSVGVARNLKKKIPEYFGRQPEFVDCVDFTPLIEPVDTSTFMINNSAEYRVSHMQRVEPELINYDGEVAYNEVYNSNTDPRMPNAMPADDQQLQPPFQQRRKRKLPYVLESVAPTAFTSSHFPQQPLSSASGNDVGGITANSNISNNHTGKILNDANKGNWEHRANFIGDCGSDICFNTGGVKNSVTSPNGSGNQSASRLGSRHLPIRSSSEIIQQRQPSFAGCVESAGAEDEECQRIAFIDAFCNRVTGETNDRGALQKDQGDLPAILRMEKRNAPIVSCCGACHFYSSSRRSENCLTLDDTEQCCRFLTSRESRITRNESSSLIGELDIEDLVPGTSSGGRATVTSNRRKMDSESTSSTSITIESGPSEEKSYHKRRKLYQTVAQRRRIHRQIVSQVFCSVK